MACAFGRPNGASFGLQVGAILTWIVYFLAIGLPAMLSIVWVCMASASPAPLALSSASAASGKPPTSTRSRF
jgi:hypothetical protein